MLIGIDASRAAISEATGTERYSRELIRALLSLKEEASFRLYFNRAPGYGDFSQGARVEEKLLPWPRLWTHTRLGWELLRNPPDVFFVPAHVLPLVHPGRSVVAIHDLGYLFYPQAHPTWQRRYLDWGTRHSARGAAHIITLSQATKADLMEYYRVPADKISVVYPGCGPEFRPLEDQAALAKSKAKYAIEGDYLLYVGTIQPRKNLERLLTAFSIFRDRQPQGPKLVLAGKPGWLAEGMYRQMGEGVRLLGYVASEDLPVLYGGAAALVFPSLYEGFGFPVVEAMACGAPVVTSTASSLPEVAGDAALLVEPQDTEALAEAIRRVVEDADLRKKLIAGGLARAREFTWTKCARETMAILKKVAQDGTA